ncbi:hypothetical protein [Actinoallomurus soli]|uniref:hypothetical protein n=1 Tax=Actinoallomurus soli TaxID=2952535 RepID=UPI00209237D5|nr:hypothetical protein [Actinoallomurus soli]MCO5969018.1 hypothetical protein [Actinoallomurus soli]
MRLKRATLTFAGAAAALAVTTLAASPAWACNDRDPGLKLSVKCSGNGQPTWTVSNPNPWFVPFTWSEGKHAPMSPRILAPGRSEVTLKGHPSVVIVVAYNPETRAVWKGHGAFGVKHCAAAPTPPKKSHKPSKPGAPKPSPTPSKTSAKPQKATPAPAAPTGEARPATPVKAQPKFTG